MALGITYDPDPAEVDEEVTLTIVGHVGDPAYARWELILVPDQSELELGMLADASGEYSQSFTPDVAGVYGFRAYDVRKVVGFSQFAGDASGGAREVILSTYDTRLEVYVTTPMDLRIQTIPGHDITLRLGIANDKLVSAEFVDHATDLARIAGLDVADSAAMTALVPATPVALNTITRALQPRVRDLRGNYELHRVLIAGTQHASADTTNVVSREPPLSDEAAMLALNELYDDLLNHMQAGASGGTWHGIDDTTNLPITPKATTKMQAHVTMCDLEERVYERHRILTGSPAVHTNPDATNVLAAPDLLTSVVVAYLDYIAANSAASYDGEHDGAVLAERMLGVMPAP